MILRKGRIYLLMHKDSAKAGLCLAICIFASSSTRALAQASKERDTAQQHIQSGQEAYSKQAYNVAIGEFKKAQSMDKKLTEPYLMLAWAYRAERRYKEALKSAGQAIKLRPNYPDAHFLMARLYFETNNARKSKQELDIAVGQGAANANVHILQADLRLLNKDYEGAVKEYDEAVALADSKDEGLPLVRERADGLKNYIEFKKDREHSSITFPVLKNLPMPNYTEEARKKGIQGIVKEIALVDENGHIRYVLVLSGLGYGLDEEAVLATKKLDFKPATKDGQPVAFWVNMEVEFNLR